MVSENLSSTMRTAKKKERGAKNQKKKTDDQGELKGKGFLPTTVNNLQNKRKEVPDSWKVNTDERKDRNWVGGDVKIHLIS